MPNVDQFESVFNAADKAVFNYQPVAFKHVVVVTDSMADDAAALTDKIKRFLTVLGDETRWTTIPGDDCISVEQLLGVIEREKPDLIATYRNLHTPSWPHSLGKHLDELTQATPVPVLVVPRPDDDAFSRALEDTTAVMAMTDHLAGEDRLVNIALGLTAPNGTLCLTHIEDQNTFDRYITTISKIPAIDTDTARETIHDQLLKEPRDYIRSCSSVIKQLKLPITTQEIVAMGEHLDEYKRLIEKHKVDLLVMNTKDDDQLAMHGLAYPLAVELRAVPMLLI